MGTVDSVDRAVSDRPRHLRLPSARPPSRRPHVVAAVALAAVAASMSGCGRDEPARPAPTTVDDGALVERLDDECAELNEDYAHLATADPSTADEAVAYAEEVDEFAEEMEQVLRDAAKGVDGDHPLAEDVQELLARTAELEGATTSLAEAAAARDPEAVDHATAEVTRLGDEINELVAALDVDTCGGF